MKKIKSILAKSWTFGLRVLHPKLSGPSFRLMTTAVVILMAMVATVPAQTLVDFNTNLPTGLNFAAVPSSYQPVPGLVMGYTNVGLFNGGPDHTTGVTGGNNYSTYAASGDNGVMVFTFNRPVSLPSFWLTTYNGSGLPVTINAYSDTGAVNLLGSNSFSTATHSGPGTYAWLQCTNLNNATYNGLIRRVEFSVAGQNPQLDDMTVVVSTNAGTLQNIMMSLPTTNLVSGMSVQADVTANYQFVSNSDVTMGSGVVYTSSNTNVVTVTTNGLVQAVGGGAATVTATLQSQNSSVAVFVGPGMFVDFNNGLPTGLSLTAIPSSYQPVPGLVMGYTNVGLFNGGPDHTTGVTGGNNYSTYAASGDNGVMVFIFNRPVSLPSFWLTTFNGSGLPVTINAYSDTGGANLLGSNSFNTATHSGPGTYAWLQCTNLNNATYNGLIRRVEFSVAGQNPQLDDMVVVLGSLASLSANLSGANLVISWPTANSAGAGLMQSPVLGPGATWTPVSGTPTVVGGNYQLTLPTSGARQFFRLRY